ncbi:PhzF family phenazine biosynthesis protein [Halostella sp. JP-L12]|uniref:PhzF family phenazine biosynthesis protein n=1 Tax=Halostella TaxID=1843185 RepID=UPI000EF8243B|nr:MULTISPECIES: PhzF family phenazine biosynthesis protein [Halostella]NHN47514.1 PhzF family phenazine biosynthesis protein [Halostella sp. JP-L12]
MVRQVRTALVDAFTDEPLTGNAAGVVPDADGLSASQMQAVARELAVSETAFLLPSGPADRKVRYFTPTQEVDLCGHATIAAHAFLRDDGAIDAGEHTLETEVGVLDVDVEDDGTVWMTQDDPSVRRVDVEYDRLAEALDVPVGSLQDIGADLPLAVASTGLPFLMVPVNFLEHVGNADPDLAAVEAICDEVDATGLYLFTFDALDGDATLHARMFAPGAGVPEDPVTGTASGAAGAYLREVSAFDGELPDEMAFEQGHYLDRPGRVRVRVGESVRVGGEGVLALDGTLSVPADDEDEILEA